MRRYTGLCRGLLLLLVVSVLLGRTPWVAAAVLYRDDFAGSSPGWSHTLGSGAANTVNFNAGGTLLAQAECCGPEFPLVGRNDLFTGTNAAWRFSLRFRYSEVTAYGTSLAIGSAPCDVHNRQAHTAPARATWEDVLHITQVQGMAADNYFRIRAFGNLHHDYHTLPTPDLNWHTLELEVTFGAYVLRLDGVPIGTGAAPVAPRSFWVGNYTTQPHWGNWSDIQVDWVQVETDLEPPSSSLSVSGTPGNAGWYRSALAVTQSATDAWAGVHQQFYRLNGGAWQTGNTYPLTGQGTTTVNYYATDRAGNTEAAQTATYRIDSVPPTSNATLNCSLAGNAGWCRGTSTVSLTGSDATSGLEALIYRLNEGLPQVYAAPFSVTSEGTTLVRYLGVDIAGNSEPERETPVRVDTVPPVTSLHLAGTPGNAGWYRSAVQATLSAVDTASGVAALQYRLNGGAWQTGSSVNLTAEGTHTLEYRATDVAGNVETVRTQTIRMDSVAPTVTGSSACSLAGNAGWCRGTATVTLTGSDATSGLAALTYEVNGGATQTYSAPWNVTGEGLHQVVYRALDVAGNVAADQTLTARVDTVAPVTSLHLAGTPGNAGWYRSAVQATLSAVDSTSGVSLIQYRVNGGAWQTGSSVNLTAEGAHTLEYRATDVAGNVETVRTQTVRIDSVAPTVTGSSACSQPGLAGWCRGTATVTLAGSDATSGLAALTYEVNGGATQTYSAPWNVTGEGLHQVVYRALDVAGNVAADQTLTMRVDTVAPVTAIDLVGTPGAAGWYRSAVQVTLLPQDATAGIATTQYRVNGGAWQSGVSVTLPTEGVHTLEYYTTDRAGNTEAVRTQTIRIDSVAPLAQVTRACPLAGNAGWCRARETATLTGSDATSGLAELWYRWLAGPVLYTTPLEFAEGRHTLLYWALDVAGNAATEQEWRVRVDSVPPTTTLALQGLAGLSSWWRSPVTATLTGQDGTSGVGLLQYQVNGGAWATGDQVVFRAPGTHSLAYRTTDVAGNSETPQTALLAIDYLPPVVPVALAGTVGNAGWYRSPVQVTLLPQDATSGVNLTRYWLNAGASQVYVAPVLVAGEGAHTLRYLSTDRAGNASVTETLPLRLDTQPPTVQAAVSGPQGHTGWYTATVIVTLTGQDATSGLAGLELAGTPYLAPRSYPTDGAYTLAYTGVDIAGNASVSATVRFWRDATPPQASVSAGAFCPQCGETLPVGLTAHDATAGLAAWTVELTDAAGAGVRQWSGSGAPPALLTWDGRAADGTLLPPGTYAMTLTVRDRAGWQTRRAATAVATIPEPPATPVPVTPVPVTLPPSTSTPGTPPPTPTALPPRSSTPQPTPTPTPTPTGLPSATPTAPPPSATPTPAPVPPPLVTCAVQLSVFQDAPGAAQYQPDTPGIVRLGQWVALVQGRPVTTTETGLVTLLLAPGTYPVTFRVPADWTAVSAPQVTLWIDAACGVQVQAAAGARIAYDPAAPVSLAVQPRRAARASAWGWLWAWPLTLSVWLVATATTDRRGRALAQISAQFAVRD